MIVRRENLYDILTEHLDSEYSIGLHGIDYNRLRYLESMTGDRDEDLYQASQRIMSNGLISNRTLNGTIRFFGRIDDSSKESSIRENLTEYWYAGTDRFIIVAIPAVMRDKQGHSLFVGSPNLDSQYKRHMDTTGHEYTTLTELLIDGKIINPQFILGTFKDLGDRRIDLSFNPRHLSFHGGTISDDLFMDFKNKIQNILFFKSIPVTLKDFEHDMSPERLSVFLVALEELEKSMKNRYDIFSKDFESASLAETLVQRMHEKEIIPVPKKNTGIISEILANPERGLDKFSDRYERLRSLRIRIKGDEFGRGQLDGSPKDLIFFRETMDDEDFFHEAFKRLDHSRLTLFINSYFPYFGSYIQKDENLIKAISAFPYTISRLEPDKRNRLDFMMKLSSTPGIDTLVLSYMPEQIVENLELNINIIKNSSEASFIKSITGNGFDYYGQEPKTHREFWEAMNERISEYNGNRTHAPIPLYDVDKEIEKAAKVTK